MDSDSEPKLISLLSRLLSTLDEMDRYSSECEPLVGQVISLVRSMDSESQPKPESELMSLVNQTISFFNSMDLDSEPESLRKLISCATQLANSIDSDSVSEQKKKDSEFMLLYDEVRYLDQEPELVSRIHQILHLVIPMNLKWRKLICLSPQVQVYFVKGKFCVDNEFVPGTRFRGGLSCLPREWKKITLKGEEATHFLCRGCYGHFHEEHEKAPVQITHPLHPKHPLTLAIIWSGGEQRTRECYCCVEDLGVENILYYCSECDFAMNIACVEKQPEKTINYPKWHQHTLALFPRLVPLTCNICALADSRFILYNCHQFCDFFVHRRCISLPRVIRISRHLHRISFDQGDWSCGVCRTKIDNYYGGYSCIKESCSYAVHSRCGTQTNVWDGVELEGVPEEIEEEELEPYVTISPGIIQHFSHLNHHLKLDENTDKDYDDHKQCQACIIPIYSGNFYSCVQCDFILHEDCAKFPRKIYHPIHPHQLTLVGKYDGVMDYFTGFCSSCERVCTSGFFYKCGEDGCEFKLDVKCATTSEPFVHGSHKHPLFLTSKPEERRACSLCKESLYHCTETFNCTEGECDFALCFRCATLPERVRYKHDKHMLTLSYGEETSVETYWCELCETRLNPKERFYKCDVYPCVTTLHVPCLIGVDLYMNPGSSWFYDGEKVSVLPNNQHMSRPICSFCNKRCPHNIVFQCSGLIFCSLICIFDSMYIA